MMETKLWIALCALLVNSGTVYCEGNSDAQGLTTPLKDHNTSHELINSTNTNSFSSNSTEGNETASVPSNSTNNNGIGTPSVPYMNQNSTPAPVSNHSSIPTIFHSTINNRKNANFTSLTSTPPSSNHTILNQHNTTTPLNQSTQTEMLSLTTVAVNISNAATTSPILAPSNNSSLKPSSTDPPANTSQSSKHPETSTTSPPNSTSSIQTKIHPESSSHLNVAGSAAVPSDSPAFDPLLAGLVSAFVITAIIITLLLFLKLRRRHGGPAFRRLQEVPMDDMEETPLYSY